MPRLDSPSSINTFKQCQRKYYYGYIIRLPTRDNIYTLRGNIVHEVLEKFFKLDLGITDNAKVESVLGITIVDLLKQAWMAKLRKIVNLGLPPDQMGYYFEETRQMLLTWLGNFIATLDKGNLKASFKEKVPKYQEHELVCEELGIKGIIDAIHQSEDGVLILDYKTSKLDEMKVEYKTQLAIYALLYQQAYKQLPAKVGIDLLKHGQRIIYVDHKLIELARKEIANVKENTTSNNIADYPKRPGPLCKWNGGACDFYEVCQPFDKAQPL